jgi:hypothetical protein
MDSHPGTPSLGNATGAELIKLVYGPDGPQPRRRSLGDVALQVLGGLAVAVLALLLLLWAIVWIASKAIDALVAIERRF